MVNGTVLAMAAAPDLTALAGAVYAASHLTGTFTLRSGVTSTEYFDKYRFEAEPVLLRDIADALAPCCPADTEALAGLELGGVPIATMLSGHRTAALFVRKEAKTYGTASSQKVTMSPVSALPGRGRHHPGVRSSTPRSSYGRGRGARDGRVRHRPRVERCRSARGGRTRATPVFTMSQLRPN